MPSILGRTPAGEIYLKINLRGMIEFKKQYESRSREIWDVIGRKHRTMLYKRFLALSAGASSGEGGQWPRLKQSTLNTKRYRQKLFNFTGPLHWILRLSQTLVHSIEYIPRKNGYFVGIFKDRPYRQVSKPASPGTEKGIYSAEGRGRIVYCSLTVAQLADVHHKGRGRVPRRPIIVKPNRRTFRELTTEATRQFGRLIQKVNRWAR